MKCFLNFLIIGVLWAVVSCDKKMKFSITRTWDNKPIDHDQIDINLYALNSYIVMEISAPFFNDPSAPNGERGKPFNKLWDYEVVEAFFLGQDEKYLEVEFSPHGQHLLLLLSGRKNAIQICLPVDYISSIDGNKWSGIAKIPLRYFPPNVNLFNAYAIHGSGDKRVYEALYPAPTGHFQFPDFHRLEHFRYVDFSSILPNNHPLSDVWLNALQSAKEGKELICSQD